MRRQALMMKISKSILKVSPTNRMPDDSFYNFISNFIDADGLLFGTKTFEIGSKNFKMSSYIT